MTDDLISRQEMLATFWKSEVEFRPSQIDEVERVIKSIPTVEAEPVRHAYWIKKMTVKLCVGFDVYEPHWYCSCCKEKYEPSFAQICKYCYVCGAKMDGKRPEE